MEFLFNINGQFYLAAYLIGAIPFGLILAKLVAGVNIKASGSQSIGATNVLRVVKEKDPVLAKKLGAITLALDAMKGMLVLTLAILMQMPESTLWAIAVLAVVGHCFSIYLMFEGGKGIATGLGVLLLMLPIETGIALIAWFIMAKTLKISSLSSLIALIALVVASFVIHPDIPHAPVLIIGFIIIYKHIPNIIRLVRGEEKKSHMTIHIEDLRFKCIIGLLEFERHTPQEVIVRLELEYDYADTFINYAELAQCIETQLQEKGYELLETAINELFDTISAQYSSIKRLFIKISKPDILPNCRVSVSNVKIY